MNLDEDVCHNEQAHFVCLTARHVGNEESKNDDDVDANWKAHHDYECEK